MDFQNLLFETRGRVALVTINRPSAMNALSSDLLGELDVVLDTVASTPEIKGVIVTGAGKAFVAGADISQMAGYNPEEARAYMAKAQCVFNRIELMDKPFLAAVNGYALGGGCELAMACDFRFAGEKAVFGQPEVNLGVIPGFGGSQRLPRLVNTGLAKELIYSGRTVKADEALRIGLVNRVCAADELLDQAFDIMNSIVSKPATAIRNAKIAINRGQDADLYKALELEIDLIALCFATEDQKEGMKAFLEKRPARFKS